MSGLDGKRVVITRAVEQSKELEQRLRERHAIPLSYPCIAYAPPADTTALDAALQSATRGDFAWLLATSATTIRMIDARLKALGLPALPTTVRVAAVGPATAQAVKDTLGLSVHVTPDNYDASHLANALDLAPGTPVLLPQSALADTSLADTLAASGAQVHVVAAYETVIGQGGVNLPRLLRAQQVDAVTLTSGSTVKNLLARLKAESGDVAKLDQVCIACIGEKTAAVAREYGLNIDVVPPLQTVAALVDALDTCFAVQATGVNADAEPT